MLKNAYLQKKQEDKICRIINIQTEKKYRISRKTRSCCYELFKKLCWKIYVCRVYRMMSYGIPKVKVL